MPKETPRRSLTAVLAIALATPALAQQVASAPPEGEYRKVSELVTLPDFLPGLGTLYVDPATLLGLGEQRRQRSGQRLPLDLVW